MDGWKVRVVLGLEMVRGYTVATQLLCLSRVEAGHVESR